MAGKSLAQGLMASSGEQLRLIYVLVMETGILRMITNKTKDLFDKNIDHSQQQLNQEIAKLNGIDDDTLRLELFLHMTKEFELAGSHYNTSYEIENKCGEILRKAHAYQLKKDKDYSAFVSRNAQLQIDGQLVMYQMQKILGSAGGELNKLTPDQQDTFTEQIEKFIDSLPVEQQQKIKEKLNIDAVTNVTIKNVIITQGSAVLLAVIVEIAGFAAYTTLTSLIAGTFGLIGLTLPFGAYMTATSVLSVLTGPLGFLLIGGASGFMMLNQSKKVKKTLLHMGIVQLILPVLLDESVMYEYDSFIRQWTAHYHKQEQILQVISSHQTEYTNVSQKLKTTEANIAVNNKQLIGNIHAYNKIVDQLANSLTLVSDNEMTSSYRRRNLQIANLVTQLHNNRASVKRNKQEHSFLKKMGGMLSNISIESDIKRVENQLQELRKEQAAELISIRPIRLGNECDAAQTLLAEKKAILDTLAVLNEQKRNIENNLSSIKYRLQQKQEQLRSLQKEIYGLGDIA
ncbi:MULTISPECIES: hypothetical protein [unclassified Paenibacillus]|uniref:hypothetical protein n=1 Tax=unclassified Paenibacillus TaxID=185978 RepID=UPI0024074299|nr:MULTISPECIES: hypothetical protein [unclassified Paenibacillus]MDF9843755.1 hypothetical protein [Paenibacillus sp. PastF-2]MDF9850406.1 hypothetical protein [Paenibacillus sp. PastM-2]MDF9856891.1 hypothetical protein [Paenibacillus sp. PastF-1]MDH6482252.1 hypothetical protein [Paenibacillus sp. PastH-2]MDH6509584.1 hypothetical protein [Paenibacillus sp. PastM-3]